MGLAASRSEEFGDNVDPATFAAECGAAEADGAVCESLAVVLPVWVAEPAVVDGVSGEACCFAADPDFHATGPIYGADYLSSVSWRTGNCAGVDNDETIKVSRSSGADRDGNQPGDLYIVIKVREDPVFRREGADIHVDAVLSITQVMLSNVFIF
uniref:Chaperone DnaJ C-terminal domain-containing protein n=1 Tax=Quercus lobata TaxID=97700 RepID=A0A7N2N8N7_QUELO